MTGRRSTPEAHPPAKGGRNSTEDPGGTRLYSQHDIEVLHRIRELLAEGLNLAGIAQVIALEVEVGRLRAVNARLRRPAE